MLADHELADVEIGHLERRAFYERARDAYADRPHRRAAPLRQHPAGQGHGPHRARRRLIVVLGSINADLVARVEHLPREGETQRASAYAVHPGGKGANQALAARRAGARGRAGRRGRPRRPWPTSRSRSCAPPACDIDGVALVDAPTGLALIHVDARGRERDHDRAGRERAGARRDASRSRRRRRARRSCSSSRCRSPRSTRAAQRADARGARVVLNAAPAVAAARRPARRRRRAGRQRARGGDRRRARRRCRPIPMDFCVAAADRHALAAIVTLGADGAGRRRRDPPLSRARRARRRRRHDAAGDAFVGALAAALDRGDDLADALADGAAAGSLRVHAGRRAAVDRRRASVASAARARASRGRSAVESRR